MDKKRSEDHNLPRPNGENETSFNTPTGESSHDHPEVVNLPEGHPFRQISEDSRVEDLRYFVEERGYESAQPAYEFSQSLQSGELGQAAELLANYRDLNNLERERFHNVHEALRDTLFGLTQDEKAKVRASYPEFDATLRYLNTLSSSRAPANPPPNPENLITALTTAEVRYSPDEPSRNEKEDQEVSRLPEGHPFSKILQNPNIQELKDNVDEEKGLVSGKLPYQFAILLQEGKFRAAAEIAASFHASDAKNKIQRFSTAKEKFAHIEMALDSILHELNDREKNELYQTYPEFTQVLKYAEGLFRDESPDPTALVEALSAAETRYSSESAQYEESAVENRSEPTRPILIQDPRKGLMGVFYPKAENNGLEGKIQSALRREDVRGIDYTSDEEALNKLSAAINGIERKSNDTTKAIVLAKKFTETSSGEQHIAIASKGNFIIAGFEGNTLSIVEHTSNSDEFVVNPSDFKHNESIRVLTTDEYEEIMKNRGIATNDTLPGVELIRLGESRRVYSDLDKERPEPKEADEPPRKESSERENPKADFEEYLASLSPEQRLELTREKYATAKAAALLEKKQGSAHENEELLQGLYADAKKAYAQEELQQQLEGVTDEVERKAIVTAWLINERAEVRQLAHDSYIEQFSQQHKVQAAAAKALNYMSKPGEKVANYLAERKWTRRVVIGGVAVAAAGGVIAAGAAAGVTATAVMAGRFAGIGLLNGGVLGSFRAKMRGAFAESQAEYGADSRILQEKIDEIDTGETELVDAALEHDKKDTERYFGGERSRYRARIRHGLAKGAITGAVIGGIVGSSIAAFVDMYTGDTPEVSVKKLESIVDPSPSESPPLAEETPSASPSPENNIDNGSPETPEEGNDTPNNDSGSANRQTPDEALEEHSPYGAEGRHIPTNAGAYEVFDRLGLGDQWEELYSDAQLRDQLVDDGSAYSLSDLPATHPDYQEHGFGWLTDNLTDESIEAIYERAEELSSDTFVENEGDTVPSDTEVTREDAISQLETLSERSVQDIEAFNITGGDGGETLVDGISKELWPNGNTRIDTEVWYRIENELLAENPREFYRMSDGHVGIVRPGYMSESAKNTIISTINKSGFTVTF